MGLITAKKRNEGWLKKTFILARNIILYMLSYIGRYNSPFSTAREITMRCTSEVPS
jgi:hypothetical protein